MKRIGQRGYCAAVVYVLVLAAPVLAAPTQLLQNTSFESPISGSPPDYWTLGPDVDYCSAPTYGASARTGNRFVMNPSSYNCDIGVLEQTVSVVPGYYNLALSFWAWVYDTGAWPSVVAGELLVDDVVVAAAVKSSTDGVPPSQSYQQVWATWAGEVASGWVKVRFTLVGDGAGGTGWGIAALDDVELFACSEGTCAGQHDVTDIEPNVISTPVATDTTVTITGTNLTNVTGVHLWKTQVGMWNNNGANGVLIAGTITAQTATSLTVSLATAGQAAGVFDLVVEQAGVNPVVISNAFEILDPSVPQNLLANPSFEVVNVGSDGKPLAPMDAVGNAAMWFGDYVKNPAANPNPTSIDYRTDYFGIYGIWSTSRGHPGTSTTSMWQTVPIAPGSAVSFSGWLDCNRFGTSQAKAKVTLYDGDKTGSTIGSRSIDHTTAGAGGDYGTWVGVTINGTSYSGYVTVELATELVCPGYSAAGAFADAFSLTASPACTGPLHPWIAYPVRGPTNVDPTLVITGGSNLDEVSAVKLVFVDRKASGDQAETVVPGTILTHSPTKLIVSFPMHTSGAHADLYNLVLEKPNAPPANLEFYRVRRSTGAGSLRFHDNVPRTFVDAFDLFCVDPVTLTGVSPSAIVVREGQTELKITGTNVTVLADPANSIKLVQGATELVATNVVPSGSDVVARFDLASAPAGFYDLVAVRGDQCDSPAPLPLAFRYSPPGSQLLPNGDFELEGPKGGDATPVAFWTSYETAVPVRYNNQSWVPSPSTQGGSNRGGISEGGVGASMQRVIQTVPVLPRYELTLTGWIYGGASAGLIHDHQVLIRDGGPNGPIIGFFSVTDPASVWTPFTIKAAPTTSEVTVEWGHVPDSGNPGNPPGTVATHVDELFLVQSASPCTFPVAADVDGDGDVDQTDFAVFQSCYTGAGGTVPDEPAYCLCFDVEGPGGIPDNDVDQADLNWFESCASGPGVPLDANCINQ